MLRYMEMGIVNYLRARFKKPATKPPRYVAVYDDAAMHPVQPAFGDSDLAGVDFSHSGDLESYVRSLTVSRHTIEQWKSTGLLFPHEMKAAEKMIQIMRRQEKKG